MDKTIKNLNSSLYQTLLIDVLNSNIENNKNLIEKYIRKKLKLTSSLAKHSKNYWLLRGWSNDEAYVKSKENKLKNQRSVYSREYWLNKVNPNTKTYYTTEEADFERNSRRPIRKEYWIKKGYTENEANELANKTKSQNNRKGANNSRLSTVRKASSKRCVEYYIARGFSPGEAEDLQSNSQKLFSKEICIKKYGEIKGIQVWQARQDDWQTKLNAKSPEEKARINRAKLSKGITVSKAEKMIVEKLSTLGIIPKTQFTILENNKKQFVYDIMYNNKIIEYNGDFWHLNPAMYSENFVNPRTKMIAKDKWKYDEYKIQFAQDQGFQVMVVWESEFKENKEKVIEQCIKFLTQ